MAYTDRQYRKMQESGQLQTTGAATAILEVARMHARPQPFLKTGSENASTNVAETNLTMVPNKSQFGTAVGQIAFISPTTITRDTSNYAVITVSKRTAGGSPVTVGTWNTHNSAQGTITAWVPALLSIATANSGADATCAASDVLTYTIVKAGTGVQIPQYSTFTISPEEV